MASRKITLCCDVPTRDMLCAAIREYAHAAYPPGGTECAQLARYTLLELVAEIDAGISADNTSVEISKRPKQMIKAALEYYFDRQDEACATTSINQRGLFVALLNGEVVDHVAMKAAIAADKTA